MLTRCLNTWIAFACSRQLNLLKLRTSSKRVKINKKTIAMKVGRLICQTRHTTAITAILLRERVCICALLYYINTTNLIMITINPLPTAIITSAD